MRLADAYFRDIPGTVQKLDYDVRTDGQPVYLGRASTDAAEGDSTWVISFFEFAGSFVSTITTKRGSWTGRVALFA